MVSAAGANASLEWGVATLTLPGERASGDLYLVKDIPGGVLIGVVDGLGHGEDAALAARRAVVTLDQFAHEPAESLLQRCHVALVGTRGVVMSLAIFDYGRHTVTWLGVGNVEGVLCLASQEARPRRTLLVTRPGIVGSELPPVRPWVIPLSPGDTLVVATDGVRTEFAEHLPLGPPQQVADDLLARYRKSTDDALVLVAKYLGGS